MLSCKSPGTAIAILGISRASSLARWHRFVSIEHREPLQTSLQGTSARAMISRKNPDLPHTALRARLVPGPSRSCNSSGTAIAILGASRGISARAMICWKVSELPRTAVQGLCPPFLQITWHGNRHSRCLQGISARAMAPICVHRAPRTPLDIAPGHIRSRGDLQEGLRPATHSPLSPSMTFREIHLEPGSPFYAGTRHISGPGGINLCSPAPFSLANYLIINNGRFQVIFTKPQKNNTPDLN